MAINDYFDDYFFTSNVSDFTCPGFGDFQCLPPNACARDPNTGRRYCCDINDVCWTVTQTCASDGSTLDCGTGSSTWCCVNNREVCTETKNQINICWSSHHDLLTNISAKALNNTFSSLSSAHPSATTWSFSPESLIALTDPAATASSTALAKTGKTSPASNPDATQTQTSQPSNDTSSSSSGLSGGAIAGIVVGVVAGVALLLAGAFLLWRRRRAAKYGAPGAGPAAGGIPQDGAAQGLDDKPRYAGAPNFGEPGSYYSASTSPHQPGSGLVPGPTPGSHMTSSSPASELHGDQAIPQELPARELPVELPASPALASSQQQPYHHQ